MNTFRNILQILNPAQRRGMLVLFVLMLLGMLMEMLGIGLVIPIAALLSGESTSMPAPLAKFFAAIDPGQGQMVIWGMLGLVAVFVVKAAFLALVAWHESGFVFAIRAELSQRLLAGYMHQNYAFHLSRNSAQLIRNIVQEVDLFAKGTIHSAATLATELLVSFGIGALLLMVEPVGALVVMIVLGLASFTFSAVTRARLLRWGLARQHHNGLRLQHLQQALGGVKDAKLLGRELGFLEQHAIHNDASALVAKRQNFLQIIPRVWLELLAIGGFALLVISMEVQGTPRAEFMPTLGLFAAAAFRLMPSANRLLAAVQALRFNHAVVGLLHAELAQFADTEPAAKGSKITFERELELRDITYAYPDGTRAIDCMNLSIERHTSVGFIGTSGAGKSTLVDVIMGLLTPAAGSILVDGKDIQSNLRSWQDQIGYVPQSIFLTDDTLRHNIAFGVPAAQIDEQAVQRALTAARLDEFVATLPAGLDTVVGERGVRLSGGQRQRIGIARALYHDPEVLVLDEATSALDNATEHSVMQAIDALEHKTILIIAHRLSTVANCNRIVRLEGGQIAAEAPSDVMLPDDRTVTG